MLYFFFYTASIHVRHDANTTHSDLYKETPGWQSRTNAESTFREEKVRRCKLNSQFNVMTFSIFACGRVVIIQISNEHNRIFEVPLWSWESSTWSLTLERKAQIPAVRPYLTQPHGKKYDHTTPGPHPVLQRVWSMRGDFEIWKC